MHSSRWISTLALFLILTAWGYAADYYWVGGSGNWSDINHWATTSGGSLTHFTVPSPSDDVYFDAHSFSAPGEVVQLNLNIITCRSLDISQATDTPVFISGVSTKIEIYGSLLLQENLLFQLVSDIHFLSSQPGNQVDPAGHPFLRNVYFNGTGGGWSLMDSLVAGTWQVHLKEGQLNTNSQIVRCGQFNADYAHPRSLQLGASTIYASAYWTIFTPGLAFDAGTSRIIMEGNGASFASNGTSSIAYHDVLFSGQGGTAGLHAISASFHRVTFRGNASISGNNSYGDMVLAEGKTYTFYAQSTHTFLDSLVATGHCLSPITIKSATSTATFQKTSGSIEVEYAELKGISATGGASFLATACTDLGTNSGWTFLPALPRTLYWVGGSGNWSDTSHWSTSSGGPSGACPPTPSDDVIFDPLSFPGGSDSVILSKKDSYCHDMTWMAVGLEPTFIGTADRILHVFGSLQFQPLMDFQFSGALHMEATTSGHIIRMAGHPLVRYIDFLGDGGGWTLMDPLVVTGHNVMLTRGHLNTNGQTVDCLRFLSADNGNRTLSLGSSKVYAHNLITTAVEINGLNLTLNAGTSEFILSSGGATFLVSSGSNLVFHNVLFSSGSGQAKLNKVNSSFNRVRFMSDARIIGGSFIDTLWLSEGKNYILPKFTVQHIDHLIAVGSCSMPILIESDSAGGEAVIGGGPDTLRGEYLILQDIHGVLGPGFVATQSVDLGNNDGWVIDERPGTDLYWVGGSGDWAEPAHWSVTSGGPGGACIPSPLDNVIFDTHSFLTPSDTITTMGGRVLCRDMRWEDTSGMAVLSGNSSASMRIYGSLKFSIFMKNAFQGATRFLSDTTGNTIISAGNTFLNGVSFNHPQGEWSLLDSLDIDCIQCTMDFVSGSLKTGGNHLRIRDFKSDRDIPKILDIRHSEIEIYQGNWLLNADSTLLTSDSSVIRFTGTAGIFSNYCLDTLRFHKVLFENPQGIRQMYCDGGWTSFNLVSFASSAAIHGNNIFDSLVFSAGRQYALEDGKTQHVGILHATGDCFGRIRLYSKNAGQQAFLFKDADTLLVDFVSLNGIHGQGGAVFMATNAIDLGDNTNWILSGTPPAQLFWVNGSGEWHDATHWSYSSGGPSGACIPTSIDDVFFDANSFLTPTDTVLLKNEAECHSMDWSGALGTPMITGLYKISVYGSLRMVPGLINNLFQPWHFRSDSIGNILHAAGNVFPRAVYFNGSGSWMLTDSLSVTAEVHFQKGSLNTGGYDIRCSFFDADYDDPRNLSLGSSTITLTSTAQFSWIMDGTNMNLDPGTSLIRFLYASGMDNQTGNDLDYHNLIFESLTGTNLMRTSQIECRFNHVTIHANARIFGKNTFDSLTFFPDHTYQLDVNYPQTILEHLWVRGNNCFPIRLESVSEGTQAEIVKTSGNVTGDFIHMRDIRASGGATFFAGANSADIANNDGWVFNNAPSYVYGLPDDTFYIKGTPLVISTLNFNGGPGTTYLWNDGSTGATLSVSDPGIYSVTVSYDTNCTVSDSIQVHCRLGLSLSPVAPTCNAYTDGAIDLEVAGGPGAYTYLWSTGDSTEDISGLGAGWYSVWVNDSICSGFDSVEVTEPPVPEAHLQDTVFCEDTSITIMARPGFLEYHWHDGSSQQQITIDHQDSIWLVVVDSNGCVSRKFWAFIRTDPVPEPVLGPDTCITFDGSILLSPGAFDQYLWQDGTDGPSFDVNQEGFFWVMVKQATCFASDTIEIWPCPPEIKLPNVFTPNGDGYNERFLPEAKNITHYFVSIFNRWGQVVFESHDILEGWDGTLAGQPLPEGTYFYVVDYSEYGGDDVSRRMQGSVTLLR